MNRWKISTLTLTFLLASFGDTVPAAADDLPDLVQCKKQLKEAVAVAKDMQAERDVCRAELTACGKKLAQCTGGGLIHQVGQPGGLTHIPAQARLVFEGLLVQKAQGLLGAEPDPSSPEAKRALKVLSEATPLAFEASKELATDEIQRKLTEVQSLSTALEAAQAGKAK